MKKKSFNITDVFIILILVLCVAGIAVRAFRLTEAKTEKYHNYRVSFTAQLDRSQLDAINAGASLKDGKKTQFTLLEGYWITEKENGIDLSGEFLVYGKVTEAGFETENGRYFKGDTVTVKGDGLYFEAALTDFEKQ